MRNSDAILNCLMNVVLAANPGERKEAMEELERLRTRQVMTKKDPEMIVRDLLLEMCAPEHQIGFEYVVRAILLCAENRKWIDNITFGLYPQLALEFDTTPSRVERAIRHVIETIWDRAAYNSLNKYFGNSVNPDKGKPTNGEFLARMANIVKMEMKR